MPVVRDISDGSVPARPPSCRCCLEGHEFARGCLPRGDQGPVAPVPVTDENARQAIEAAGKDVLAAVVREVPRGEPV